GTARVNAGAVAQTYTGGSSMAILRERWLEVAGFPEHEVSNTGKLRRRLPSRCGPRHGINGLRQQRNRCGYYQVHLFHNGKVRRAYIHVLVAEAFIGPKSGRMQVNHKDGDKSNNSVSNLEYVTPAENVQHAYDTSIYSAARGERHGLAILTEDIVRQML
ncbi:MAG: HNH endonuclease signature motif containing protein, partial [Pseudomonadota bacterium]